MSIRSQLHLVDRYFRNDRLANAIREFFWVLLVLLVETDKFALNYAYYGNLQSIRDFTPRHQRRLFMQCQRSYQERLLEAADTAEKKKAARINSVKRSIRALASLIIAKSS